MNLAPTNVTADRGGRTKMSELKALLDQVADGTLGLPPLSAEQLLSAEQIAQLYTLLEAGYPLPSLVIAVEHSGDRHAPWERRVVAGHSVLEGLLRYSHPRAATEVVESGDPEVYRVLGRHDQHGQAGPYVVAAGPVPATYLPARAMWRTLDFLAYRTRVEAAHATDAATAAVLVAEAEEAAHAVLSATVPVTSFYGAGERVQQLATLAARLHRELNEG
ncbi:hypothetical protein [Actinomadura kijaniata]|uniref:hypothetical protein n=1 Tax=Actinomadura kijaniata TaxID=46161 RepID=UPI00082EC341|nr:hypothetical protein [Actinomadura kijaniata]